MSNNRYIARIDHKHSHCYVVRFQTSDMNDKKINLYHKTFTDNVCGGKRKALTAARKHRDKICKKYGKPLAYIDMPRYNVKVSAANRSGVVGVTLNPSYSSAYNVTWYWIAYWQEGKLPGKRITIKKCFGVARYGYEEAFWLAVNARYKGLGKVPPDFIEIPDL